MNSNSFKTIHRKSRMEHQTPDTRTLRGGRNTKRKNRGKKDSKEKKEWKTEG